MHLFNGQTFINSKDGYMIIDGQVFCEKKGWLLLQDWKAQLKKERQITLKNNK
tara:strand:- start:3175 stop:3333 length:159 start_codon:yes stop_codon:yes gene_type:complete